MAKDNKTQLKPLRLLIIEDSPQDAELVIRELRRGGFDPVFERADTSKDMAAALDNETFDVIISDFKMPSFTGHEALLMLQQKNLDIPFIIVSGTIGEETAVSVMKAGASDYIMKDNLHRLPGAVERELRDAEDRRARKKADEDLKVSNEWLSLAQSAAKSGLWSWEILKGTLVWSKEFYELFEIPADSDASFDTWKKVLHPDDVGTAMEKINRSLEERKPLENEYRIILPGGGFKWIGALGNMTYDNNGTPVRMSGICMDITERKKMENNLRESETLFRTLTQVTPTGIYLTDAKGNCIYANEKWLEMAGMEIDEALGQGWTRALHPDDMEFVVSNWNKMVESKGKWNLEYRFITPSGRITTILGLATELRDEKGNITGYVGSNIDITDRKHLEEALEKRLIALTSPIDSTSNIKFEDLFNVDEIQKIQDSFAKATGVASIITDINGRPITKPSNFCHLCENIIRKTKKGLENCFHSDAIIGRKKLDGPVIQPCLSGGLWDAGTSICVGDRHIANWLVGQVLDDSIDQEKMLEYARKIGADEAEFKEALESVTRMPRAQFEKVVNSLFLIAGQLSRLALQNVQQARYISERKKAETELKTSEERFRLLFNTMTEAVALHEVVRDPSGEAVDYRIIDVNPSFEKHTGIPENKAKGVLASELYGTGSPPYLKEFAGVADTGRPDSMEIYFEPLRKHFRISIFSPGTNLFATVFEDISERKQMEEKLRQSEKMDAIGQLAGGIAHDFNNQLVGILGYSDMLTKRLEDDNLRKYAENIVMASRRAADLTRDLLAFARKGKYQTMPVNVHKVIEEVVSILQHTIDKRIEISRILAAYPATIMGDPTQIQNAILNLALNARDAMPNGGNLVFSTMNLQITEADRKMFSDDAVAGPYLKISVKDDGTGIDKGVMKRIFEPFFTTKAVGKGSGMGLPSVYGMVKSHQGFINVESEIGKGSTFSLYFPVVEDIWGKHDGAQDEKLDNSKMYRILVVDDEEVVRDILAQMLRTAGHKVVTCRDGAEAVAYYANSSKDIDLVILDLEMPRMNGKDTFFRMKALNPEVKVCLSSGYSIDGNTQNILDSGAIGFMQKPFNANELLNKIKSFMENSPRKS